MSETNPAPRRIVVGRKPFGPCGACAFFVQIGEKPGRVTGTCHGTPPAPTGWARITSDEVGCAAFVAADVRP